MEENYRRYPIGIQNFEQLRNLNCVCLDNMRFLAKQMGSGLKSRCERR